MQKRNYSSKTTSTLGPFRNTSLEDIENASKVFNEIDYNQKGYINSCDLESGLKKLGIEFNHPNVFHKMVSEIKNTERILFADFLKIYMQRKNEISKFNDGPEMDVLDAFVAQGGNEDGGGNIDADKLIDIIKKQFEMTIDIEGQIKMIDEDGSGEIEYGEFQQLLENEHDNPEIATFNQWFDVEEDDEEY